MLKITLIIILKMLTLSACSNDYGNNGHVNYDSLELIVTVLEITDTYFTDWPYANVLVDSEQGQLLFNHNNLGNTVVNVGDKVEIQIVGDWVDTDPAQVSVKSWILLQD